MANIKSAKKRAKQTVVRNARNVAQRSMLRTAVKKVIKAIDANDATAATEAFASAQPLRVGSYAEVLVTSAAPHFLRGELVAVTAPARHKTRIPVTAASA